jgi:hypothetical protein
MTVSDLLEQLCYKSDIMPSSLPEIVTACSKLVDDLLADLLQDVRRKKYCYIMTALDFLEQPCNDSDNIKKVVTNC